MHCWRTETPVFLPWNACMKTIVHQASFPYLFTATHQMISLSINEDEQNIPPPFWYKKFPSQTTAYNRENILFSNWSDKNFYFPCSDHRLWLINKELRDPHLLFFLSLQNGFWARQFLNRWSWVLNNNNWGWNDELCVLPLTPFFFFRVCSLCFISRANKLIVICVFRPCGLFIYVLIISDM